ncbi:hypothetical protein QBC34DRAFT_441613 [Podospora aff. communis PSN243]|uniref:Uncharacterized protein n=1 Tax=Podospora aff. communis PSN243 TaxID=3040156 RepID=A0AAV9GD49_9PEZI|nr:hypothetical protein QBC34DRAFT_441613 [Podospora aff. communis PSN243]
MDGNRGNKSDSDEEYLLQDVKPTTQEVAGPQPSASAQTTAKSARPFGVKTSWIVIFAASWAVILVIIVLLLFMWHQSQLSIGGSPVSASWEAIREPSRLFATITISAMVVRTAIAFQTGILTAILASVLLRRYLVPIERAPGVLMMRGTRSCGPSDILLSLGYRKYWSRLEFLVATAIWLATLGLQATSTLLASDLDWAVVPSSPVRGNSSFDFSLENEPVVESQWELLGQALYNGNQPGEGSEPWLSRMESFPAFGEYSEPPTLGDDYIDTGLTMRAFLPFASAQQRESLLEYHGPARVMEAQVVCVQPVVDANITLRYVGDATLSARPKDKSAAGPYGMSDFDEEDLLGLKRGTLSISGMFGWDKPLAALDLPHGIFRAERSTTCAIPKPAPNSSEVPFSLCVLDEEENLALTSSMSGVKPMLNPEGRDIDNPESSIPPVFVVVRGATNPDLWKEYLMDDGFFAYAPNSGIRFRKGLKPAAKHDHRGPWATLALPSSDQKLDVSLCFASNTVAARKVALKAEAPRAAEPTWTWEKTTGKWNSDALGPLLGDATTVGPGRPLRLAPLSNWTQDNIPEQRKTLWKCDDGGKRAVGALVDCFDKMNMTSTGTWRHWDFEAAATFSRADSIYLCSHCGANGGMKRAEAAAGPLVDASDKVYRPHRSHTTLFQSMMEGTGGNLAVSLQALFTVLFQAVYYEYLPSLTMSATATAVFGVSMRIPVRWAGLGSVLALLCVHLAASAFLLGLFLSGASGADPFVGETWQAVAQSGRGSAVEEVLATLGQKTDEDVERSTGSGQLVGLGEGDDGLPVLRRRGGEN